MQPDPIRVEETLAWMKKSRKDLWRADCALTLDPPDTEDCLFHCQQAVEKALKAILVWRDQSFRRTHDLVELTTQCVDLEPGLSDVMNGLGPLTRFAWEFR
jgi:HEPN domain-containing protein